MTLVHLPRATPGGGPRGAGLDPRPSGDVPRCSTRHAFRGGVPCTSTTNAGTTSKSFATEKARDRRDQRAAWHTSRRAAGDHHAGRPVRSRPTTRRTRRLRQAAAACYLLHAFPDRFTHEFFIRGVSERGSWRGCTAYSAMPTRKRGAYARRVASRMKTRPAGATRSRRCASPGRRPSRGVRGSACSCNLAAPECIKQPRRERRFLELQPPQCGGFAGSSLNDGAPTISLLPPGFGGGAMLDALQSRTSSNGNGAVPERKSHRRQTR